MTHEEIEEQQENFCQKQNLDCFFSPYNTKVGFAIETEGQLPINGLRHPPQGDTNGWYIWSGDTLSTAPDFFSPLHTLHLIDRCPEVIKFLGLPPGYRFLVAGDYVDVWFDPSLLNV